MTGRNLVKSSLRLIGVLAPGETPSADEATDGLSALNALVSSWSTESLIVPTRVRESFSLTATDADYTMGSGGNFNTSKPLQIEAAAILQNSIEEPVRVITVQEWAAISQKTNTGRPTDLWPQPAAPLWTINLYPVPDSTYSLILYSQKALTSWTTLDTDVSLLDGYERALKYNLAVDLAPEYGKPVPDSIAAVAVESKSLIERMNSKSLDLQVDLALQGISGGKGGFNIFKGYTP